MRWMRRVVLALPFTIALGLNLWSEFGQRGDKRIEVYGFAFGIPWAWIFDQPFPYGRTLPNWLNSLMTCIVILWGPALMYSLTLWAGMTLARHLITLKRRGSFSANQDS